MKKQQSSKFFYQKITISPFSIINMRSQAYLIALLFLVVIGQAQLVPPMTVSSLYLQSFREQKCCGDQTITVSGSGIAKGTPDIATLSAQITVNANTVNQAISALTQRVSRVVSVLSSNGLNSTNYQTSSLNVYPNVSYANGVATVIGQIATQGFSITIPSINPNGSNVGKLIDDLATVNGIVLKGLSFDISNKTDIIAQARANAFNNAKGKALDYSSLLKLSLGQLLTVTDSYSIAPVVTQAPKVQMTARLSNADTPTTVNVGTVPISYNLEAIYSFGC